MITTTRVGTGPATTVKYREMVVFDVDGEENLVVYIGSPNLKTVAAQASSAGGSAADALRGGERRQAAKPAEHKASGKEEPEKLQLTWARHVLGKGFTRHADGTISFRPGEGEVMPYPVLPLPPAQLKEKEGFELTVPDLAQGEGKTVQVVGQCKVAGDGKVTIDGRLQTKIVPGSQPELAIIAYDIPATASGVASIRMTRRVAGEAGEAANGEGAKPGMPPHGEKGPKPAAPAAQQPLTSIVVQLVSSKPVAEELRRGLIAVAGSGHEGQAEAADGGKPAAGETTEKNNKVPSGDLWGQIEQIGTQAKEKSEGAVK